MDILTTDFHTHILPGIDDGSQSVDDSIAMLLKEQSDGVDTILLTPHFYPQTMFPDTFLEKRQIAMDQLRSALPQDRKMPHLIPSAEVQYCPGMSQWEQLNSLAIGDSKHILIEMPYTKWSENTYAELKRIRIECDLTPIIAHVERYLTRYNMNRVLNRLLSIPVLLQMNCEYLTDIRTQRTALKLISAHKIHLIGSDCHSSNWRSPTMAQARDVLLANADEQTLLFMSQMQRMVIHR